LYIYGTSIYMLEIRPTDIVVSGNMAKN